MNDVLPGSGVCHNCGAALHGRFCAACGQEALSLDPTMYEVVREVAQELLDVDGRAFRSVRRLFLSPGFLTREHFSGRRVPWLSPIRLYLIFSVAYFAVIALGGTNVRVNVTGDTDRDTVSELRKLGFATEQDMREAVSRAQATWMPRVNFVLVPFFGWLVSLVRRASRRRYPKHLQFALHAHAAWFGASAVAAAGRLVLPAAIGGTLAGLCMLYGIVYVAIGLREAYGITTRRALRDTAILLGVYGVSVVAATLGVVMPAVLWHR